MKIAELKKRRKNLTAVVFEGEVDAASKGWKTDSVGYPVLDSGYCAEAGLAVGDDISEERFCELYAGSQYVRAREKALWYIDYSDISKKGLYGKLRREYGEEISARVSDRMEELGLIDDRRYAERYAEILLGEKRVAPRKAIMMMTAKGIDRETARSALEQVGQDPVGVICELIEKKYISRMHDPDGVRKTVAALARRGFSFSDIREAVKRYNDETEFYEE